jgi:hypothetical protein
LIEKHAFGEPVMCSVCEQPVDAVWAESYAAALNEEGVCQTCHDATHDPLPDQPQEAESADV